MTILEERFMSLVPTELREIANELKRLNENIEKMMKKDEEK